MKKTAEHKRLIAHRERQANWRNWGPYLSERAWGTVREDYSASGDAWTYFTHDQARGRAYRWNEDGLAGISDRNQYLCFSVALWNGQDPILKERLFGLTGPQGNHGEDVKEYYFYLDNTPTHSYMKMLYKYPQSQYPYGTLVSENARRGYHDFEYELLDTGIFDDNRYFDLIVEYAKADQDDILIQLTLVNRGPEPAACHLLPTLWFRNTWAWGYEAGPMNDVTGIPILQQFDGPKNTVAVQAEHPVLGDYMLYAEGDPALLFTENETNQTRLFGSQNSTPYVKDAFHRYLINGHHEAINPDQSGTKTAVHYQNEIPAGESVTYRLRLTNSRKASPFGVGYTKVFDRRVREADDFYAAIQGKTLSDDERNVQRQALAGMLWSKQLYYYDVEQWLWGDPAMPAPATQRQSGRNNDWRHLTNFDIISMPDKWEYPWYATWDSAFHCLPLALVDADFAKRQLELITREWYMRL